MHCQVEKENIACKKVIVILLNNGIPEITEASNLATPSKKVIEL